MTIVASLNPLTGILIGIDIGHGTVASQRLTIEEMIDGYTRIDGYTSDSADTSFDEGRKSRLAPRSAGRHRDPHARPADESADVGR